MIPGQNEKRLLKIREQNSSITYLGDENFKPPVPVLLKSKLHEKLGSRLATKNVSLAHLEVSVEGRHGEIDETTYRSSTAGMGIDPISDFFARWIIKGIEGRKLSRYIRVELKGSLDERPFSVVENGFFKNDGEIEVKRIVLLAVDKAVDSIESLLKEQNQ